MVMSFRMWNTQCMINIVNNFGIFISITLFIRRVYLIAVYIVPSFCLNDTERCPHRVGVVLSIRSSLHLIEQYVIKQHSITCLSFPARAILHRSASSRILVYGGRPVWFLLGIKNSLAFSLRIHHGVEPTTTPPATSQLKYQRHSLGLYLPNNHYLSFNFRTFPTLQVSSR